MNMVIAPDNNLIPYPGHHYQVQPYIQDNRIANQEHEQRATGGRKLLRRPQTEIRTPASHLDRHANLYDFKLFLQYPASDPIGLMVDVYA
jgi:hypothetical protein